MNIKMMGNHPWSAWPGLGMSGDVVSNNFVFTHPLTQRDPAELNPLWNPISIPQACEGQQRCVNYWEINSLKNVDSFFPFLPPPVCALELLAFLRRWSKLGEKYSCSAGSRNRNLPNVLTDPRPELQKDLRKPWKISGLIIQEFEAEHRYKNGEDFLGFHFSFQEKCSQKLRKCPFSSRL